MASNECFFAIQNVIYIYIYIYLSSTFLELNYIVLINNNLKKT